MSDGGVVDLEPRRRRQRKPRAPAASETETEIDLANRFLAVARDDLRYCADLGGWLAWDGKRWARDRLETAREIAKASARSVLKEAAALIDPALFALGKKAASARGVVAILDLARSDPRVAVSADTLDVGPYLLNVANGTLDLRTGTLRAHERGDLITKLAPVGFEAAASCPRFDAFLAEILPDLDVRAFVQRWAGYAATAAIREHVLPVAYGTGANGKSTLFELLATILGDYASAMPDGFLAERRNEEHATGIARLRGTRLAVSTESRDGCALDEARVKRLTGGDTLTGRFMRGDFFDFAPTAKFVLLTNHRPRLRGTDDGIRRRVMLVPFDVTIPEDRRDAKLRERIIAEEAPGVLRWLVEGAAAWFARSERLDAPAAVRAATADYHAREDVFARFLDERCTLRPADERPVRVRAKPADLFKAFCAWCEENGERNAGSLRGMSERLATMGYVATKSDGSRWYAGIRLASALDRDARDATKGSSLPRAHGELTRSGDPRVPADRDAEERGAP